MILKKGQCSVRRSSRCWTVSLIWWSTLPQISPGLHADKWRATARLALPCIHHWTYTSSAVSNKFAMNWSFKIQSNASLHHQCAILLITAPSLGVYYFCRWLCLSVHPSVCLSQTLKKLLFCFSMESSHFLAISSLWQKLQNVVLRFLI